MNEQQRIKKYTRGWNGGKPETVCGWGSKLSITEKQRQWIPKILFDYNIKTIADIGAGDLHWVKKMDLHKGIEYTPYDLVPRLPEVQYFDLLKSIPPKVDLLMCLWVLNHFSKDECRLAIENIKASGSKYLLITYRPKYAPDLPIEHEMPFIEEMLIDEKMDCYLRLVDLESQ